MGCVLPEPGFLEGLASIAREHGALLIFDEVMTGFRVAYGGAQEKYGVVPDLTILGKIVGGGLPAAAYGGRRDLMAQIAPEGPVYQAGTLSGNPLAMAAGLETLRQLRSPGVYAELEARARTLADGLDAAAREAGVEFSTAAVGGMFGFFFHPGPVRNFDDARKANGARFRASSTRCSMRASISRPRRSRLRSCRWRTGPRTSRRRSRRRAGPSKRRLGHIEGRGGVR